VVPTFGNHAFSVHVRYQTLSSPTVRDAPQQHDLPGGGGDWEPMVKTNLPNVVKTPTATLRIAAANRAGCRKCGIRGQRIASNTAYAAPAGFGISRMESQLFIF
jgi:hypothetical protein